MLSGVETGTGGVATIKASIEYPVGTITIAMFTGSSTGTTSSLTNLTSDSVNVTIPAGAKFYVRTWLSNASGIIWNNNAAGDPAAGSQDVFAYGGGASDMTAGGNIVSSGSPGLCYFPIAIIGQGSNRAVLSMGDSRALGLADLADYNMRSGIIERAFDLSHAITNVAHSGDWIRDLSSGSLTNIIAILQYFDYVAISIGINDISNGRTANQLITDYNTLVSKVKGNNRVIILTTINPKTTLS